MEPEPHVCKRCHAEAHHGFGETWLCEDCHGIVGSCCMEFDGDDQFLEDRTWWDSRMAQRPDHQQLANSPDVAKAARPG